MIDKQYLYHSLQKYFSYDEFRTGQLEIISSVLKKQDTIAVLPTGTGKSICYQLPALLQEGTTIIISPLISLMLDQVKDLKAKQIKQVVAITSFMSYQEKQAVFSNIHLYKMIFISPELLQQHSVIHALQKLNISLFVIDEAHCISQWGHAFRPDYLRLERVIKLLENPPLLALSATAPLKVQDDIETALHRNRMKRFVYPMDRPNIGLFIQQVTSEAEKKEQLLHFTSTYDVPTLIYFSSRRQAEEIAHMLSETLNNRRIAFYHGEMEHSDRITVQQQFMNNQLDIICCTSAFGMGINKGNIRLVIHYHFPGQLESYIQEFGRAGRDGKQSMSVVLHAQHDQSLPFYFIEQELPSEEVIHNVIHYIQTSSLHEITKEIEVLCREAWDITEVQWRFLLYQLEFHGMIKETIIVRLKDEMSVIESIKKARRNRLLEQQNNIKNAQKWLYETDCLRKELYSHFQDQYTTVDHLCCSICHTKTTNWNLESTNNRLIEEDSWEKKLQYLLGLGVYDESK